MIAVPIAGVFILILLVLMAVRMLRADTRRHTHTLAKTQLYVPDYADHHAPYGPHHPLYYHPQYGHYVGYTEAGKGGVVSPGRGGGGSGGGSMVGGGTYYRGCVEDAIGSECGGYEKISDCGSDFSSACQGPHTSLIVEQKQHGPGTIV